MTASSTGLWVKFLLLLADAINVNRKHFQVPAPGNIPVPGEIHERGSMWLLAQARVFAFWMLNPRF
jgi:hypothetical protein